MIVDGIVEDHEESNRARVDAGGGGDLPFALPLLQQQWAGHRSARRQGDREGEAAVRVWLSLPSAASMDDGDRSGRFCVRRLFPGDEKQLPEPVVFPDEVVHVWGVRLEHV